ncbi:Uncharacterised protein [Legionella cincinnatiensis]|uniref:Uncharacterized protein n=1 Tax=Legionella cincinnatiensis TaxID=28085 RepID=A0A378IM84_9GAMM|nr:Uncharacterised protein [Legionella cincinnatiensis]
MNASLARTIRDGGWLSIDFLSDTHVNLKEEL